MNLVANFCFALLALFSSSWAFQIASVEQPDGSFSIGRNSSDSKGDTVSSVESYLTFRPGWTPETKNDEKNEKTQHSGSGHNHIQKPVKKFRTDMSPTDEFFKLLAALLRFKVQLISRTYQVFNDNARVFRSVYGFFLRNLDTVHQFTTTGIVILRSIFDFAAKALETWEIPSLNSAQEYVGGVWQFLLNGAYQKEQQNYENHQNTDYYDPTYESYDNQRRF